MEKRLREHLPGGEFKNVSNKRSRAMSAVRGKGNKTTEVRLRLAIVRNGIKNWTMHTQSIPGKPDFFFSLKNLAIFVDGCFWHGCPDCGHFPKTNASFWRAKIERNRERDKTISERLKQQGTKVLRFWEHELQNDLSACINRICSAL